MQLQCAIYAIYGQNLKQHFLPKDTHANICSMIGHPTAVNDLVNGCHGFWKLPKQVYIHFPQSIVIFSQEQATSSHVCILKIQISSRKPNYGVLDFYVTKFKVSIHKKRERESSQFSAFRIHTIFEHLSQNGI